MIIVMILLELIEANLQSSKTLGAMIDKLYGYYKKSVFLFFMVHPTFYFVLLVSLYFNIVNFYIIAILLIKSLDILFKVEMIKQRYIEKDMDQELTDMLGLNMSPWMGYIGLFTYVPLLFMAITPS